MSWQILPEYPNGTIGQSCIVCHSDLRPRSGNRADGHEVALSTGVFLDFEGLIVLCESCVTEAAGLIGMVDGVRADELRKRNRELGRQNHQFKTEVDKAKHVIQSLKEICS